MVFHNLIHQIFKHTREKQHIRSEKANSPTVNTALRSNRTKMKRNPMIRDDNSFGRIPTGTKQNEHTKTQRNFYIYMNVSEGNGKRELGMLPCKQSQFSASLRTTSRTESMSSAPSV